MPKRRRSDGERIGFLLISSMYLEKRLPCAAKNTHAKQTSNVHLIETSLATIILRFALCSRISEMCCRCGVRNANVATANAGPCAPLDGWGTISVRCTRVAKGLNTNRSGNLWGAEQKTRRDNSERCVSRIVDCVRFYDFAYCPTQRRTMTMPRNRTAQLRPTSASVLW